jgi:hypothetical protein
MLVVDCQARRIGEGKGNTFSILIYEDGNEDYDNKRDDSGDDNPGNRSASSRRMGMRDCSSCLENMGLRDGSHGLKLFEAT